MSAKSKVNYYKNKEKIIARQKKTQRPYLLQKKYKITMDDFEKMLESQNRVCKICGMDGKSKDNRRQHLCVDHCHKTGKVRGLLCMKCNTALGAFEKFREPMLKYLLDSEK